MTFAPSQLAASAVQATAGRNGTPAALRMLGLTKRMYDIVKNVVIPAIASVLSSVREFGCFKVYGRGKG